MSAAGPLRAGKAVVEFVLSDKGLAKGLSAIEARAAKTGEALKSIGTAGMAVGGAITGAFGLAVKSFMETGDALNDMATRTGVSVEKLSELSFAASQSGTNIETVEKAFRGMSKFSLAASNGSQGVIDAMAQLGLAADALAGKSPDQQFQTLADAVANVPDPTTRAALAMKVFGKAGSDLLPMFADGAAGMAEMFGQAKKLGQVMSTEDAQAAAKLDDAMNLLWGALKGVANTVGATLVPHLTAFVEKAGEAITSTIGFAKENSTLVQIAAAAGVGILGVSTAVYAVGTACSITAAAAGGLSTALTFFVAHPFVAAAAGIVATVAWLANEFRKAHDDVSDFDEALKKLESQRTAREADEVQGLIQRYEQLAAKAKLSAEEQDEARRVIMALKEEFGALGTNVDRSTGAIVGADKARAQLQAARGGQSVAAQNQQIAMAESGLAQLTAEGADKDELAKRAADITRMREKLERTQRIVADAAPMMMPQMPSPVAMQSAVDSARAEPAAISPRRTLQENDKVVPLLTEIRDLNAKILRKDHYGIFAA